MTRRGSVAVAVLALGLAAALAGNAAADSGPSGRTFTDIVADATVVLLGDVSLRADGGVLIHVEQVLKGNAPSELSFDSPAIAPPLFDGSKAVVAFTDPSSIDFRAPTIAWRVGPDGRIDPDHFQQYPGLPPTLDEVLIYFGVAPVVVPTPIEPPPGVPWFMIAGLIGIGALSTAGLLRLRRS